MVLYFYANIIRTPKDDPASTRPRLQAINQDFSDLDDQIRQAAHIIGLPDKWSTIEDHTARAEVIRHLVRARAEWVLRWILEKLKDDTDAGKKARGSATAWQLLEWMIHVLPVSRSAPHLRDAGLTTVLERTLFEHFETQADSQQASSGDILMKHISGSSDSESQPSRKRKRGSAGVDSSSSPALERADLIQLFRVITSTISTILTLSSSSGKASDNSQNELMKMVLRTGSAQASRILRFWLTSVSLLLDTALANSKQTPDVDAFLDISLVMSIWELRQLDSKDEGGASADDFSTECLVPTLTLLEKLRDLRKESSTRVSSSSIDHATQALDKILARHLFAPSRAAFFNPTTTEKAAPSAASREATALMGYLAPLRAKLLQAAQIEDTEEPLPVELASLFRVVSHLLDLAIRASPSRTPKGRLAEKPWIQATFASLAECAGCSPRAAPELITRATAVSALEGALHVLQVHNVSVNSELLKTIFWYYSGVKYPEGQKRTVHWSLIASLIELDPSVFVIESKFKANSNRDSYSDLAEFVFEQISVGELQGSGFEELNSSALDIKNNQKKATSEPTGCATRAVILERIIVPLMLAFVRNRNLLGFLRKWDHQLVRSYRHESRKILKSRTYHIWEDRTLNKALAELLEQSLTQGQITTLVQEHAERLGELGGAIDEGSKGVVNVKKLAGYKRAASSAVIIPAILQSIQSHELVNTLRSQLALLFRSYSTWVQDDRFGFHSELAHSWLTLCQLLRKTWPIELHTSKAMQQDLLHPLIVRAAGDLADTDKGKSARRVDSRSRAAAMMFSLNACSCLQTVPESEHVLQSTLKKLTESMFTDCFTPRELAQVIEVFCTYFVELYGCLDAETCKQSLLSIVSTLSQLNDSIRNGLSSSLSHSIINDGTAVLKTAYYTVLIEAFSQNVEGRLHDMSVKAISYINPSALSREQREAILNQTIELIGSKPRATIELLSIATQIMEIPNATATISTDSNVLFAIAENLHKQGCESPTALQLLRKLVDLVVGHMIPNEGQVQNKSFFKGLSQKLDQISTASKKCSAARLSILRATIVVQKQTTLLDPVQYVELLKHCLTDGGGTESASLLEILDAFNEIPLAILKAANMLDTTRAWLRIWVNDNSDIESYKSSQGQSSLELAGYVARLHTTVAKFKLYSDAEWLFSFTVKVVQEPLSDGVKATAYEAVKDALSPLPFWEKLDLIPALTGADDEQGRATRYRILSLVVATLEDKVEANAELKQRQLALLPNICVLLADSPDYECFNVLLNCVNTMLNDKPALVSQYSIECVLSVLLKLTSRSSPALSGQHASEIFSRLCETSRLILLVHRGRLGGRFHILIPLLQGLLFCLFIPNSTRSGALPAWLRTEVSMYRPGLTPANATQFSRLLSTLCNPPQSSITKAHQHHASSKSKDLNDPVKAARERASNFLYPLLASFCRYQLSGRLDASVKEKLMPGVWEVVGTAGLHKEVLDAMFAGLGRSERDVWRGVWGEWESLHGRKQVVVHGE